MPALVAVAGQLLVYYWLELLYAGMPAMPVHGINANFIINYPMMLLGTSIVMSAFALAYRSQESRVVNRMAEHALAGD